MDERGRLILYTTPRCTVASLAEKIHTALTNVGELSQMRLRLAPDDQPQTRQVETSDHLPLDRTLQSLHIPSGSVVQIAINH